MKPEIIEFKNEEVALYDLPQTEEGNTLCNIDIAGLFRLSNKEKVLMVVLPQHSNEVPVLINVGLNDREISKSIDILTTAQTYGVEHVGNIRALHTGT
jgi:hypothetical protein